MKLHICGVVAATILLTGCGQMGPLVLPPKETALQPKAKQKTPVAVQPPVAMPPTTETPASGVSTAPPPALDEIADAPAEPEKEAP